MDLRLTTAELEADPGVKLKLIKIPREIMERNRKSPPPFLEMAILEAEAVVREGAAGGVSAGREGREGIPAEMGARKDSRTSGSPSPQPSPLHGESATLKGEGARVDIKLTRFMPNLAEVPGRELEALRERAIKSGMDFIDFWAVDFAWQRASRFTTIGRTTAHARTAA